MAFSSVNVYSSCTTLATSCTLYTNALLTSTAPAGYYKIGSNVYVTNSSGVITSVETCAVTRTISYTVDTYTYYGGSFTITNLTTSTTLASGSGAATWDGYFDVTDGDQISISLSANSNTYVHTDITVNSNLEQSAANYYNTSATYTYTVAGNDTIVLSAYDT